MQSFQFTRPRGARLEPARQVPRHGRFNSRAHGGRDQGGCRNRHHGDVSIHAPTGGATCSSSKGERYLRFQFTRPRGARQGYLCEMWYKDGFNSRAHGGRDRHEIEVRKRMAVSIHAPTGGATVLILPMVYSGGFQFTRPRGARRPSRTGRCR